MMNKKEFEGISFGFKVILIWLIVLTTLHFWHAMNVSDRIAQRVMIVPPIEIIEVD